MREVIPEWVPVGRDRDDRYFQALSGIFIVERPGRTL